MVISAITFCRFTLPDSDTDKVSDYDNVSVHSYGTQIRIGIRLGIGIGQCNNCTVRYMVIISPITFCR